MGRESRRPLILFLFMAFGGTALGVLLQRGCDGVLRVERWSEEILAAAAEADLSDPFLLAGLVYAESRGEPGAISSAGAEGLCQLMPATAREVATEHAVAGPPFEPVDNLRLGALYLKKQLDHYGGDMDLALLAYRLGPGAVDRGIRTAGSPEAWLASLRRRPGSPWEYRTKVLRFRERFFERAQAGVWPAFPASRLTQDRTGLR